MCLANWRASAAMGGEAGEEAADYGAERDDDRQAIEERFARPTDHDLVGSLLEAGSKLAARRLSELGEARSRLDTAQVPLGLASTGAW
jgi:hypothetical protein